VVASALVAALLAGGAIAALLHKSGPPRASPALAAPAVPDPVARAFTVATPRPLEDKQAEVQWAAVQHPTVARSGPRDDAAAIATLETSTPEGTANIVLIVGRAHDAEGRLWVRVRLPVLPNNTTGWVARGALGGYVEVRTRLVVDLTHFTATLSRDGRTIFRAMVGVGRREWPTPRGEFYIRNQLTEFRSPFYGPVAFGTSARSAVLTDWPAGGFIGIHGTHRPDLLPGRVSHGCIRMRNADILRLARLMPVGTTVTIR
jgi:lipoprotein-anchoring transpeptidase ErfK/SrfK